MSAQSRAVIVPARLTVAMLPTAPIAPRERGLAVGVQRPRAGQLMAMCHSQGTVGVAEVSAVTAVAMAVADVDVPGAPGISTQTKSQPRALAARPVTAARVTAVSLVTDSSSRL